MIKILLVDDCKIRSRKILDRLNNDYTSTKIEVTHADSLNPAKRYVKNNYYDLLILDVVLPLVNDGEENSDYGLQFLSGIKRRPTYVKPGKIVGITAFSDKFDEYNRIFSKHLESLLQTETGVLDWLDSLSDEVGYLIQAKITKDNLDKDLVVLAVHGIRTFGKWYEKLEKSLSRELNRNQFIKYDYGWKSFFFFISEESRQLEVNSFYKSIRNNIDTYKDKRVVIVSHSFGTYLVCNALDRLYDDFDIKFDTVILAGSVLKDNYQLDRICKNTELVINDCGCRDAPLCFSEGVVTGMGMAGRTGFRGGYPSLVQRFFKGGHSLYFGNYKSENFMEKYWINPILDKSSASNIDHRPNNIFSAYYNLFFENLGKNKPKWWKSTLIVLIFAGLGYLGYNLYFI